MKPSHGSLAATFLAVSLVTHGAFADKSLSDYKYFRSLSIDLNGRIPTRDEITAFESPGFDLDGFIDARLSGPAYADRIRRIYQDLMRLQVSAAFNYLPSGALLRRVEMIGPDGKTLYVYARDAQRRARPETSGAFCMTADETGLSVPSLLGPPQGTAKPVDKNVLEKYTRVVRPWWLYTDYRSANPSAFYNVKYDKDARTAPNQFAISSELAFEKDGTPATQIRVCAEEANTADMGTIDSVPQQKWDWDGYVQKHSGEPFDCRNQLIASGYTVNCGCGVGMEHCLPMSSYYNSSSFFMANTAPLGYDQPLVWGTTDPATWERTWWAQEFVHFFDHIMSEDRDFRELLTARYTMVNGPLAQFYGAQQNAMYGYKGEPSFGGVEPENLFNEDAAPKDLVPSDVSKWELVPDRGPLASGLLTMPIFLTKYGTRRARAHVLWNAFACKDFVAENTKLPPSDEPDLTKREGCSTCHSTLEPLAAYFSRVEEGASPWSYLPPKHFALDSPLCRSDKPPASYVCSFYYDTAFTTAKSTKLLGSYSSPEHAEAGPVAFAQSLVSSPDYPGCVAAHVAESFLGRALTADDAVYKQTLAQAFVAGGFKMKSLVRALVKSNAYHTMNDSNSADWRKQRGAP